MTEQTKGNIFGFLYALISFGFIATSMLIRDDVSNNPNEYLWMVGTFLISPILFTGGFSLIKEAFKSDNSIDIPGSLIVGGAAIGSAIFFICQCLHNFNMM